MKCCGGFGTSARHDCGSCQPTPPPTCGGNGGGAPCKFPFTHNGQQHSGCIATDHGEPWCYTTAAGGSALWGNCNCRSAPLALAGLPQTKCLAAAVAQFGAKVTAKRSLVTGSWSHVLPGCSVQSGGDWAAHFNSNSAGIKNDGSYTAVGGRAHDWAGTCGTGKVRTMLNP